MSEHLLPPNRAKPFIDSPRRIARPYERNFRFSLKEYGEKGLVIAHFGAGDGSFAARAEKFGAMVHSIDPNPAKRLRADVRQRPLSDTGLEPDSVDMVILSRRATGVIALNMIDKMPVVDDTTYDLVQEGLRVLKPDGKLHGSTFMHKRQIQGRRENPHESVKEFSNLFGQALGVVPFNTDEVSSEPPQYKYSMLVQGPPRGELIGTLFTIHT